MIEPFDLITSRDNTITVGLFNIEHISLTVYTHTLKTGEMDALSDGFVKQKYASISFT